MPTYRAKACGYYRDQDLRFLNTITPEGERRPVFVEALVRGYQKTYTVRLENGVWTCTCDLARQPDCAHRAAIQLATGYRSSAAAPAKAGAQ